MPLFFSTLRQTAVILETAAIFSTQKLVLVGINGPKGQGFFSKKIFSNFFLKMAFLGVILSGESEKRISEA